MHENTRPSEEKNCNHDQKQRRLMYFVNVKTSELWPLTDVKLDTDGDERSFRTNIFSVIRTVRSVVCEVDKDDSLMRDVSSEDLTGMQSHDASGVWVYKVQRGCFNPSVVRMWSMLGFVLSIIVCEQNMSPHDTPSPEWAAHSFNTSMKRSQKITLILLELWEDTGHENIYLKNTSFCFILTVWHIAKKKNLNQKGDQSNFFYSRLSFRFLFHQESRV